ncbi:MAG: hypothetical protein LBG44_00335 [Gemmatimonadota bacterium]|jgi:zinc protease|nr:hypothetical protein [Gemmatimonadota bacterium]
MTNRLLLIRRALLVLVMGLVIGMALPAFGVSPAMSQERLTVITESGTPVVAAEILMQVGAADEEGNAGITHLAGRSVLAAIRPSLDSLGVRAGLVVDKDAFSISIIAAPDVWEKAMDLTLKGLFEAPPPSSAVLQERAAILAELRGRVANPADAATRELDRAVFGADHPWGRPEVGTVESVGRLTANQVQTFTDEFFVPARASVAIVGPVEIQDARARLPRAISLARGNRTAVDAFDPEKEPVIRSYNSVTSWVSVSYPFSASADEEAIRFATFLTADALSYSPRQRSIYNLQSEVVPRAEGGEMRIQIVVPPEEAIDWAERLIGFVANLRAIDMHDDEFESGLRRFRGERTMALITPEARAHAAARALLVGAPDREALVPEMEEMTLSRLHAAADHLGPPVLVVLGPISDQD